jgi:ABC-2 type transport system permease protein
LDVVVLSFIEAFILIAISHLLKVNIGSGLLGFLLILLLLFLTVFFVAGISYSISFLFQDENPFIALVNTFIMPLFFVSTALMPYDQIPGGFRIPVILNPFTHVINSLRNIISGSYIDWSQILFSLVLLAVLCILSFMLAVHSLNKESR